MNGIMKVEKHTGTALCTCCGEVHAGANYWQVSHTKGSPMTLCEDCKTMLYGCLRETAKKDIVSVKSEELWSRFRFTLAGTTEVPNDKDGTNRIIYTIGLTNPLNENDVRYVDVMTYDSPYSKNLCLYIRRFTEGNYLMCFDEDTGEEISVSYVGLLADGVTVEIINTAILDYARKSRKIDNCLHKLYA